MNLLAEILRLVRDFLRQPKKKWGHLGYGTWFPAFSILFTDYS